MATFEADNGREFELSEQRFVEGDVEVDINDLISGDLEDALDLFSEKLVGNELLSDLSYKVVGVSDGQVVVRVAGSVEHILANREENEGVPPFSL